MSEKRWPKPPKYEGHPNGPWWCGRCGGCHGWDCPYDPAIYGNAAASRMEEDRAKGVGPFMYGPSLSGTLKEAAL